ncbi:glycosyltransferase [Ectothiorhodospira lacustris]|uniref:glycosyltransferase n=1 Tax=Ectothiorhodospira lacustris TaxID=2899127 RepID=UPI001EE81364|nr:glycosyltransferase [Ectothiorhodospira lacustris]MCG5510666.1 glycosyltransferase [Ectothiorhodospira lacustris]MCG5522434.1 glycosyltransferase [Ectothiorhodospira lacustris]
MNIPATDDTAPSVMAQGPGIPHPYHQPVTLPFTLPTRLYGGMLLVWLLRPALQRRFPLHLGQRDVYLKFLAWCTCLGRRQYALLRSIDAWNEELMRPMALPPLKGCPWQEGYTVGMYLAGITRSRYWHGQVLGNRKMRHLAARWYFREGRDLMGLNHCPPWQQAALEQGFASPESFLQQLLLPKDHRHPEGPARIHQAVEDIVQCWGQAEAATSRKPVACQPHPCPKASRVLAAGLPVISHRLHGLARELQHHLSGRQPDMAQINRMIAPLNAAATQAIRPELKGYFSPRPFGVNLIGYARGELGIGEDIRTVARSLQEAGVPFCIVNVEPGADVSQGDTSAEHWITDRFDYAINLFCMTGIEMARMTAERGFGWLEGHYNIGLWPWELPEWPQPWQHTFSLVDELWGISPYTAKAYAKAPVPVVPIPLPVDISDHLIRKDRAAWGLPEDAYLFVFSFDMNSTLARKNPVAVVKAFLQAFAEQPQKRVGLVIKVSHLKQRHPDWKHLSRLIKKDDRIQLIKGELRKSEVLSLYKSCDCFVSLHRAEGFGRGLAEAQLLGLEIIATGYSGNMVFCADNDTRTVDYRLIEVGPGEYFYGDGQHWADPDIPQAARLMAQCAESPRSPTRQLEYFSPRHCGTVYAQRLNDIMTSMQKIA